MLFDSHCHLYFDSLNAELPDVLDRAQQMGVTQFICIGVDLDSSRRAIQIAEDNSNVYATAGIHPHDAKDVPANYIHQLEGLLDHPKVVAVGEIGLDYFRNLSEPAVQRKVFRDQIDLAREFDKPIVFHNRNADEDIIETLETAGYVEGVAHCFSSDFRTAQVFLDLKLYISFAGNLTYRNSHLPDIARMVPLERLLIETDSPFLSATPHRGKANEPWRLTFVAEKLAEIHEITLSEIADITRNNTERLFRLQTASD
jgi:TatD DNase family protein